MRTDALPTSYATTDDGTDGESSRPYRPYPVKVHVERPEIILETSILDVEASPFAEYLGIGSRRQAWDGESPPRGGIAHADGEEVSRAVVPLDHRVDGKFFIAGYDRTAVLHGGAIEHRCQFVDLPVDRRDSGEHLGIVQQGMLVESLA